MKNKTVDAFLKAGAVSPFLEENTAHYFENSGIPFYYIRLIPGYIYTFASIKSVTEAEIPSLDEYQVGGQPSRKPYFDRRPIILSLGQEGPMEVGLNLKIMPLKMRSHFLTRYYGLIAKLIEKSEDEAGKLIEFKDRFKLPENSILRNINRNLIHQISEQSNFNLTFLVDKYNRGEMSKITVIDWDQAVKLPRLSYANDGSIISKTPISYFLTKIYK